MSLKQLKERGDSNRLGISRHQRDRLDYGYNVVKKNTAEEDWQYLQDYLAKRKKWSKFDWGVLPRIPLWVLQVSTSLLPTSALTLRRRLCPFRFRGLRLLMLPILCSSSRASSNTGCFQSPCSHFVRHRIDLTRYVESWGTKE